MQTSAHTTLNNSSIPVSADLLKEGTHTHTMALDNRGRPTEPPETMSTGAAAANTTVNDAIGQQSVEELIANFPESKLSSLISKISNSRWIVPVLPDQELECLLNYAIRLTKAGCDHECDSCMRFYRESMYISFIKILTDEAVNSWKYNIHFCILNTCGNLLQLIALHMQRDNLYLLELLAVVLDPENRFNTYNVARVSDQYTPPAVTLVTLVGGTEPIATIPSTAGGQWGVLDEQHVFARSPAEPRSPRGWLVDLINRFGQFGGFDNLLDRFNAGIALLNQTTTTTTDNSESKMKLSSTSSTSTTSVTTLPNDNKITLQLIHALLRPFGQCYELLTIPTIEKYFMPIWEVVLGLMDRLSDEDLKREAKHEGRSDSINGIVKLARALASRLPNQENLIKDLEMFRLKMILRLLKVSSFNGKMNALNEINKMLSAVTNYPHRTQMDDDMDWLTAERMAVSTMEQHLSKFYERRIFHTILL